LFIGAKEIKKQQTKKAKPKNDFAFIMMKK
jgi:hypothetical protein